MASCSLRFIHASDFHLERPLSGLAQVPTWLGDLLVDAPLQAARRVFDAALREQVDFVLLAGDLLRPTAAGPRALVFLVEQFERLNERQVPVYWATGKADAATRWTDVLHLPPNIHLFATSKVERVLLERERRLRVEILGRGNAGDEALKSTDFRPAHHGSLQANTVTIALAHGRLESRAVAAHGVHYWALGGTHRRRVASASAPVVHYPGTPQGRRPRDVGPHGCTLAQVDDAHRVRTRHLATDAVRWHEERIRLEGYATASELQRLLESRAQALLAGSPQHELLVCWKVQAPPRLSAELRRGKLAVELLDHLRAVFGKHRPGLFSWSLEADLPAGVPEPWYAEETLRGEFLRSMRAYAAPEAAPPDFEGYLSAADHESGLADAVVLDDEKLRRRVLAEATLLGADLLTGEESHL